MSVLPRSRRLRNGFRQSRTQARIAGKLAAALCRFDARLGALGNQGTLELGNGTQDLQRKHALRRGVIDRIVQRAEMRALGFQLFDNLQQMADGSAPGDQAVSPALLRL